MNRFRPSQLEQLEGCPLFENDNNFDPQAAEEGTLLHAAVQKGSTDGLEDEQKELVQRCLNYKDGLPKGKDQTEYYEYSFGDATADYIRIIGTVAYLVDWKFGRIPVTEACSNPQVQAYALRVFNQWPAIQTVHADVVCPRQDMATSATFLREDVRNIQKRITRIIALAEDPGRKETPCEKSCRMCGRKAVCPAITRLAMTVCQARGLTLPAEFEPGKMLLPVDRARAQILSYILEDWCGQVRKLNAEAALNGTKIPGFEVRTRQGSAAIENVPAAFAVLRETYSIMSDELLDACKVSVTKLIDCIHAVEKSAGKKVTKDGIRSEVLSKLAEYVKRNEQVTYLQRVKGTNDEEIIQGRV